MPKIIKTKKKRIVMFEIVLGIVIFISFPTAYIITTENIRCRMIFKRAKLSYIDIEIKNALSGQEKCIILHVAYLLKFADFYFTAGRYIDAIKHYNGILTVLVNYFFKTGLYPEHFKNIHKSAVKRIKISVKEMDKSVKRRILLSEVI
jgi:energy-converting hydrogenase Eha subunit C